SDHLFSSRCEGFFVPIFRTLVGNSWGHALYKNTILNKLVLVITALYQIASPFQLRMKRFLDKELVKI
ncbi:unnamed protein product, partial [Gulo gulo]